MDSTDNFSFSIKAQNVEAQFYNKKAIVYVEGDDDLLFWRQHFPDSYFEIKKVDGCKNLEKKIYEIENSGLKCIVACDSDYKSFEEGYKTHPLVVHTLSHSIECMMYCPVNLNECIKKLEGILNNDGRILIRPSGTEPVLRVLVDIKGKNEVLHDEILKYQRSLIERC